MKSDNAAKIPKRKSCAKTCAGSGSANLFRQKNSQPATGGKARMAKTVSSVNPKLPQV